MAVSIAPETSATQGNRASQRAATRNRMLQAALDIIIEEGIRTVRHRAVAQRAGVSLGSTTYHFSSIEELIISAFGYWREKALLIENPFYIQTSELLEQYQGSPVPAAERAAVGARILEISVGYMESQLAGKREDRLLELAFHHESVRFPSLKQLVLEEWQAQHEYLVWVHRAMGSVRPEDDARATAAVLRQLEHMAVMSEQPEPDMPVIRSTLQRHLSLCLGIELAMNAAGARS